MLYLICLCVRGFMLFYMVGSLWKKQATWVWFSDYLEPRIFTKWKYKRLIFSKEKDIQQPLYTDQRKIFFSLLLREKFSPASCFGSDKGVHTLSADRTWVITWKISGDSSWSNKYGGDGSWSNMSGGGGSWSNRSGGGGLWSRILNHFSGKSQLRFSRYDF